MKLNFKQSYIQIFFLLFGLLFCNNSKIFGQQNIIINEEESVKRLMEQYVRLNRSVNYISGWRITVITTADRRQMEETKLNFAKQFSIKTKWEYKEPYYHLKAGAYISRNEANYALESIKKKFPAAFLSVDKILYDEF